MDSLRIKIRRLHPERDADIPLPRYMTSHCSGMDIHAAVASSQILVVGAMLLVPTGIAIAVPEGFEAQVRPRSGLACKEGVTIINAPGTIDADYRGEIQVCLINLGTHSYTIRRGDRIAQLVIQKVCHAQLEVVTSFPPTERNQGGFGHTGS